VPACVLGVVGVRATARPGTPKPATSVMAGLGQEDVANELAQITTEYDTPIAE
jgi:hypothetical protein